MMKAIRIVLQSLVAGSIAVAMLPTGARADSADELKVFGYITNAAASPVAFVYDQPSFGVPATPTFEIRYFQSEAHTDSGPSGRALSSVVWPGDLAGNAPLSLLFDSFLPRDLITIHHQEDTIWDAIRAGIVDGSKQAPPYPERAECFFPSTKQNPPKARNDLGGGISMACSQTQFGGQASTTGNNAGFPGMFSANNLNSSAFSGIRDGVAVSEASTAVKEMSLLGGLITVEGFATNKTVTSDGLTAKIEGGMQISGLTINGTRVLSVDTNGPKVGDQSVSWDQAMQAIHDRLEPQGITVKLAQDIKMIDGADGKAHIFGISIRLDSRAMKAFRDSFPEPLRTYLTHPGLSPAGPAYSAIPGSAGGAVDSVLQFDQSFTVLLGDVTVNSIASPPLDFGLPPITNFPPQGNDPVSFPTVGPLPQTDLGPTVPGKGVAPYAPATRPVGSSTGVPTAMAILTFALAAAATVGLRLLADRALKAAPEGARCSL